MTSDASGASPGDLPLNAMKEHFSVAFVGMVVAAAGFYIKSHTADYDGVDLTITSQAEYQTYRGPEFELQIKCTSRQDVLREHHLAWRMRAGPYRKLTDPKRYNAAYLGVLLVPGDPDSWLEQDETLLTTGSVMYWQRAKDLEPIADGAATKTVYLPRSNLFNVGQLRAIMNSIGDGGDA
jgi:Domain of unknown function (DUF4365)